MCLTVYLGAPHPISLRKDEFLSVEALTPANERLRTFFANPHVYYIGSKSGCGCSFPSWSKYNNGPLDELEDYMAEFSEPERRELELKSAEALIGLLKEAATASTPLELLAVWNDGNTEEALPHGVIDKKIDSLQAKKFVLNESYMHRFFT